MELPNSWEILKLREVATYINGKAFKPSEWSKEGLPIIRIQNLNQKKSEFNYCNFSVDDKYYVNKGDLLFAWSGTPDTSFGAHIWLGERAVLNQHIFRIIIDKKKITKQYYLYALNHKVKEFVSKAHGTAGLAHITKKKFEDSEIAFPTLPEQHQIVAKIEEFFSELDNGIESLKKARDQLKIYRQAVLKYAFEGKLTKEWRTQHLPAGRQGQAGTPPEPVEKLLEQIKTEREKHYQRQLEDWKKTCEQAKTEGKKKPARPKKPKELPPLTEKELVELPKLPDGWGWVRLEEIAYKITDGTHHTPEYIPDGVPFISVKDIFSSRIHFDECKYISKEAHQNLIKRCHPEEGDLLITKSGTIGRLAIVPRGTHFSLFVSVALVKKVKESVDSHYLKYCMENHVNHLDIDQDVKGGLLKNYHLEDLRIAILSLCGRTEQDQIVQNIESRLSVCDKIEQTIEDSLNKAEALRQSILKKAFSGELTKEWRLPAGRQGKNGDVYIVENRSGKLMPKRKEAYFVYVLECEDGSIYKGVTSDLNKRINDHLAGIGAEWTKAHRPIALIHYEEFKSEKEAVEREKYLKSGVGREWLKELQKEKAERYLSAEKLLESIKAEKAHAYRQAGLAADREKVQSKKIKKK